MSAPLFSCPVCHASLRVRDRSWIGREINCPECKTQLALLGLSEEGWEVRRAAALQATPRQKSQAVAVALAPLTGSGRLLRGGFGWLGKRPLVVAWLGALVVAGVAVAVVILQHESAPVAPEPVAVVPEPVPATPSPAEVTPTLPTETTAADRMTSLGARIDEYLAARGEYPAATTVAGGRPATDGFSWLAQLEIARLPPAAQPHPSLGWTDPTVDTFVRQPVPEYLNPSQPNAEGADRRPVTHFVGITGVGADAAELPLNDPRAGMFGYRRTVTREDLVDGASQTWMVAGATQRTGSWAAAGDTTLRALTAEPYINGSDGLGTGQADAMPILMADGSVRTVSAQMDPVLLRRMAAINDGLPLDATVPGDPARLPPRTHERQMHIAIQRDPAAPPADALEPAREEVIVARVFDLEAALAQLVPRFEQAEAVPVRELVQLLEDLSGAHLRGQDNPELAPLLDRPLAITLTSSTVGAVLSDVLKEVGLAWEVDGGELRLVRRGAAAGTSSAIEDARGTR